MKQNKLLILINLVFLSYMVSTNTNIACASNILKNHPNNDKLSEENIATSALKNYPEILKFYEKINNQQGKIVESSGFFDIKLKGQYQDKTRGYYDGLIADYYLEKQNGIMGSKIYGGWRRSSGDFASYDGNYITNEDGEFRLGASLSLLRNRDIDAARLDLLNSNLSYQEAQTQIEKLQIEVKRDAIKAYYNWLISGHIYKTYYNLYELAKKRQEQLKIRNQKGDIANIILVENQRNILQRNSIMLDAKNNFDNAAIALSLYFRDDEGSPIVANEKQLPDIDFNNKNINFSNKNINADLEFAMANRPEIRIIRLQKQQEKNSLAQAKNLYQPRLDISFEASKDQGYGPPSRSQTNNQLRVDFELPIEQNIAKGKILQSSSKLKLLNIEEQFYHDKITNEINQINNSMVMTVTVYNNYLQEYELSTKLEKAEKERFIQGNSDFFLINLREQEVASAKINKLIAYLKYQAFNADYNVAIFRK